VTGNDRVNGCIQLRNTDRVDAIVTSSMPGFRKKNELNNVAASKKTTLVVTLQNSNKYDTNCGKHNSVNAD
jgi:hypothetical protein